MLLLRHLERIGRRFRAPALTLGNFDGVHRGHQEILRRLVTTAHTAGSDAVALTFHPHPAAVLAPDRAPRLITDWRTRVEHIAALGVDAIIVQRFTPAFSQISADDFVRRFLVSGLGVRTVVVGHRVSFGHHRTGNAETLQRLGHECGFGVEVVGPIEVDNILVSSSAVRDAISGGNLSRALRLLGHLPSIAGRVVHGRHRGRQLGFPTANLRVHGLALPPDGVYAVRARLDNSTQLGVANLGLRPTFAEHERSLEVHLLDFDGDLYGKRVEVDFVHQLRGEMKFPGPDALMAAIARDIAEARRVLEATTPRA
ncbi:MAG TPA: bifunctional riboflavin kinase/FAD synthetase [Candidatus Margulisiibacteriota bacterium]|nr:bifunctional riboflavin kinase/FAD synthetase [Candidatus Margulisiibacteriota bacterium]